MCAGANLERFSPPKIPDFEPATMARTEVLGQLKEKLNRYLQMERVALEVEEDSASESGTQCSPQMKEEIHTVLHNLKDIVADFGAT